MKKYLGLVMCLVVLVVSGIKVVNANVSLESLNGMVIQISSDTVVVAQEQEDGMRIAEIAIVITPETRYKQNESFEVFKEGDVVKVVYRLEDEKKIAVAIEKFKFNQI